ELSGRITAVPIVSMPSFRARTAFVMPEDGKNLNRCFPGSDDGTFSDVLARTAPADAPIGGTTSSAAAAAGVPAVIAEVGGCGLLEEDAVRMHLDGIGNALRHLHMLPGEVTPPRTDM